MVDAAVRAAGDLPGARLIAADVGGTYARLGLVGVEADGGITVLFHRRYPCANFGGLAAILRRFREECEAAQAGSFPADCVVAIAGVLQGKKIGGRRIGARGGAVEMVGLEARRGLAGLGIERDGLAGFQHLAVGQLHGSR